MSYLALHLKIDNLRLGESIQSCGIQGGHLDFGTEFPEFSLSFQRFSRSKDYRIMNYKIVKMHF